MRAIFISYRRDDSEGQAGRLMKDLASHFGQDAVFMDVAAIAAGRDFRRVIDENVGTCGVLLALIGKAWVTAQDASGRRRLDDPADFVRLETASALKRDIPVIPVLVHGAVMPKADQLPSDLAELAYRNGVELTHARWDSDVQVLIKALEAYVQARGGEAPAAVLPAATPKRSHGRSVAMAAGALMVIAAAFGGYLWFAAPEPVATPVPIATAGPEVAANPVAETLDAQPAAATPGASASAAEAERMARAKAEQEALAARIAADKRKADTLAANNAAAEKAARDKVAADKALADRATADRAAADKLASDRALVDKAAAEKQAADRALADKTAADRLESDRAAAAATTEKLPQEQRTARQLTQRSTRWTSYNFPPPNGGSVLIAILSDGNPACASYNAASCLWGVSLEQLDTTRLRPLVCGELHRARWGVTGYDDPKHWCSLAKTMNDVGRPQR